ncbi:MAG: hypothetical protein U1D55_18780 [Phycisphaerae bacterium]
MRRISTLLVAMACCCPAFGWGAYGHRTITYLALDSLPAQAPAWLRDETVRHRIAYQSSEPDRWRGWRSSALTHENDADHYIDVDLLDPFGLTLDSLPPLRYEYLRALAIAKHVHPESAPAYDASSDPDRTKEWPGFLPYAIVEHYAKLQAAFNQVRMLEQMNEPARAFQLQTSRENAIYHMGILSHFVGDAAQPLHTTIHHHGWVGANPNGYTTDKGFHALIDTGILDQHHIAYEMLRPRMTRHHEIHPMSPWDDVLGHIRRSFDQIEPLYQLEKSGALREEAGKELICERLIDGATMLRDLYWAAYQSAAPTPEQMASFVRYAEQKSEPLPSPVLTTPPADGATGDAAAASQPAVAPTTQPTATPN